MIARLTALLLTCTFCHGANFYVTTNGNDSADGSFATPWLTIQKGVNSSAAGDTINVGPGEFNEFVGAFKEGSAGSPITFTGTRGSNGEWLTIIDPSTNASTGWIADAAISGCYTNSFGFEAKELTIDHKRVPFLFSLGDMSAAIANSYVTSGLTTGASILAQATNATVTLGGGGGTINFWDAPGALFTSTNGITYLKLGTGGDPNGMNIRVCKNTDASWTTTPAFPVISINTHRYNTIKNFLIRGSWTGFYIRNGAHHNIIESNYISGGYSRLLITLAASNNIVRNNTITGAPYGLSGGAWDQGATDAIYQKHHCYLIGKQLMGNGTSFAEAIYLNGAGNGNLVYGNTIADSLGNGFNVLGSVASPVTGTEFYSNIVERCASTGALLSEGETGTLVHDNLFSDSNENIRLHHLDAIGETNRVLYIYRNRFWLPVDIGEHIFTHMDDGSPVTYHPLLWVYHNSFNGGMWDIQFTGFTDEIGGHTNFFAINNAMSSGYYFDHLYLDSYQTNAAMVGAFDYNWIPSTHSGTYPTPIWFGANNLTATTNYWTTTNTAMALSSRVAAINTALDTSSTFTVRGRTFVALPDSATRVGFGWDIGALEFIPTFRVGQLIIRGSP